MCIRDSTSVAVNPCNLSINTNPFAAASDVYKRQVVAGWTLEYILEAGMNGFADKKPEDFVVAFQSFSKDQMCIRDSLKDIWT